MEKVVALLSATQRLLDEAGKNLEMLEPAKTKDDQTKFLGLVAKHAEAASALAIRKKEVLSLLVQCARLIGFESFEVKVGWCFDYTITNSNQIVVSGGHFGPSRRMPSRFDGDARGSYSFEEFIANRHTCFYAFCETIVYRINDLIARAEKGHESHAAQTASIKRLLAQLHGGAA